LTKSPSANYIFMLGFALWSHRIALITLLSFQLGARGFKDPGVANISGFVRFGNRNVVITEAWIGQAPLRVGYDDQSSTVQASGRRDAESIVELHHSTDRARPKRGRAPQRQQQYMDPDQPWVAEIDSILGVHRFQGEPKAVRPVDDRRRGAVAGSTSGAVVARPGLPVRRGPDWSWSMQDGGIASVGEIVSCSDERWCTVRWPNGHLNGYRVGGSEFDLEVAAGPSRGSLVTSVSFLPTAERRHQDIARRKQHQRTRPPPFETTLPGRGVTSQIRSEGKDARIKEQQLSRNRHGRGHLAPGAAVTRSDARPGLRVQRGPDWRWGNQDGGLGSVGTLESVDGPDWATVRWPSGHVNGYRIGDGGKHDLVLAGRGPKGGCGQHNQAKAPAKRRQRCWCIDQFGEMLEVSA